MTRTFHTKKNRRGAALLALLAVSCCFTAEAGAQAVRPWLRNDSGVRQVAFHQPLVDAEQSEPSYTRVTDFSPLDRLAELEDELISLRQQLQDEQQNEFSYDDWEYCADNDAWWRPTEIRGGVDIVLLKPRFEDGAEEDGASSVLDFHLDVAPRIWLELANSNRQGGIRARYWQYTHASRVQTVSHVPITGNLHQMLLDAYSIDLEVVKYLHFDNWQLTFGTGVRYAWLEQQVAAADTGDFVLKRYSAVGPTLSLDTRHQIGRGQFAWVANARGSILVGESVWSTSNNTQTTDDIGANLEMQLGLEWLCRYARVGELFVRMLWEQQYWFGAGTHFSGTNTVGNGIFGLQPDDYDVAFMGFGLAVGIVR